MILKLLGWSEGCLGVVVVVRVGEGDVLVVGSELCWGGCGVSW